MKKEIIKKIQELVPDVMKLEFGCEFLYKEKKYIYTNSTCMMTELHQGCYSIFVATPKGFARSNDTIEINENYPIEILGKPITLAVVLRAILKHNNPDSEADGLKLDSDIISLTRGHFGFKGWDLLNNNFNEQSEDTKDFIGELLK